MSTETQCAAILDHLRKRGSINPMIALKRYGCFRLAARVKDLKDDGHLINTTLVNRRGKRYAAYSLVEV